MHKLHITQIKLICHIGHNMSYWFFMNMHVVIRFKNKRFFFDAIFCNETYIENIQKIF